MKELNWQPHPYAVGGKHAKIFFENGYGVSILFGDMFYSNGVNTYEVAIIKGNEDDWDFAFDTPIADDVLGYLSMNEVQEVIKRVENL